MGIQHTYKTADGKKTDHSFTRGKAIRAQCLECSLWQPKEVRLCPITDCSLYPYRMRNAKKGLSEG